MKIDAGRIRSLLETILPWSVLAILLAYTYAGVVQAPYVGFHFNASSGQIGTLYLPSTDVQTGDRIVQVGSVKLDEYLTHLRVPLFGNMEPGESVFLILEREGEISTVSWITPGPTFWEIADRVVNVWLLAYVFWLAGVATLLFIRPKDNRWRLLIAFYFLTALWLITGGFSHWVIWNAPVVMRMAIWVSVPVYLHLHWTFPRSLGQLPASLVWGSYLFAAVLAVLQWLEQLPASAYALGFLLACVGSFALLVAHALRRPDERRDVFLLLTALGLAVLPAVGIGIAAQFQAVSRFAPVFLLALPILPGGYFYISYRRQVGGMTLRGNRLVALYLFLIVLGTTMLIAVAVVAASVEFPGETVLLALVSSLMGAGFGVFGFPQFQRFVEYRLLSLPLPPADLVKLYAFRLIRSLDEMGLVHLLTDEILPSLQVRQSALFRFDNNRWPVLVNAHGIDPAEVPTGDELTLLLDHAGRYRFVRSDTGDLPPCPWVRLVLPLRVGEREIGVWLLGQRDPDDIYAISEIDTFQALANQTALALVSVLQSEQLQAGYRANLTRQDRERISLARILHDEILNELAVLAMHIGPESAAPTFKQSYQSITTRLRQIVAGLRPAHLSNYGLSTALEELVDSLSLRLNSTPAIQFKLPDSDLRYPAAVEHHLFWIVEQAAENAIRHAEASSILIQGRMMPNTIDLVIEDDGKGFTIEPPMDLAVLLSHQHFGLVGMYERAAIIGANLVIGATPTRGTRVCVTWTGDPSGADEAQELEARLPSI